ncbi:hypothetical protein D3C78_1892110 [compost metagenome]
MPSVDGRIRLTRPIACLVRLSSSFGVTSAVACCVPAGAAAAGGCAPGVLPAVCGACSPGVWHTATTTG